MRVVREQSDFKTSFERAVSEAKSAFGDGTVFIERFLVPELIARLVMDDLDLKLVEDAIETIRQSRQFAEAFHEDPDDSTDALVRSLAIAAGGRVLDNFYRLDDDDGDVKPPTTSAPVTPQGGTPEKAIVISDSE